MNVYKRVSIVGNSAAGKSTLSRKIGEVLHLEIFTIDKIYWMPGWKLREQTSYQALHEKWISNDRWLIDGVGYWDALEKRLSASDLVIYYDVPVSICIQRAKQRIVDEKNSPNLDIVAGCLYQEVRDLQMDVIKCFEAETRPKLLELLDGLDPGKKRILKYGEETKFLIELEQSVSSDATYL